MQRTNRDLHEEVVDALVEMGEAKSLAYYMPKLDKGCFLVDLSTGASPKRFITAAKAAYKDHRAGVKKAA